MQLDLTTPGLVAVHYPWQQSQWDQLSGVLKQNKLGHSLLVAGPAGVGKAMFAMAFAHRLLCEQKNRETACCQCKSCLLLKAGTHPDFLVVTPEESGKPIKIDQVRALVSFVTKRPQFGGRRIVLLSPAEAMNVAAANALLKSLEEPGAETLFILVSSESDRLPATVRSRCQRLDFPVPALDVAKTWLSQLIPDQAQSDLFLSMSSGRPLMALALKDDDWVVERQKKLTALAEILEGRRDPVSVAAKWHQRPVTELIRWWRLWLQDVLKCALGAGESALKNPDLMSILGRIANLASAQAFASYDQKLLESLKELQRSAQLNSQLLLEKLLIEWRQLGARSQVGNIK